MNQSIGDAIVHLSGMIENTIKTIAPQVWEIYLRQQYITFWTAMAWIVLSIPLSILCFKYAKKLGKEAEDERGDGKIIASVLLYCTLGFIILVSVLSFFANVGIIFNPEYYVIQELMRAVK